MLKKFFGHASKGEWVFNFVIWCGALSYAVTQQPPEHLTGNSLAFAVIVLAVIGSIMNVAFAGFVRMRRDR